MRSGSAWHSHLYGSRCSRSRASPEHIGPGRKQPVDLRGRKGDMQEEPDCESGRRRRSARGTRRQVEVVDPHPGSRRADTVDRLGKALVHLGVDGPGLGREAHAVDEVVEERPEGLVADAAVERLLLRLAQEDRNAPLLGGQLAPPLPPARPERRGRANRPRPPARAPGRAPSRGRPRSARCRALPPRAQA